VSFLSEIVAALGVSGSDGGFGLFHELFYLVHHLLAARSQLTLRDLV
jgi:hypothetical protein